MQQVHHSVIMLQYPVNGIRQTIKQERGRTQAKWKASVNVEMLVPLNTQKVPILWVDWNQSECILEVDFTKKCIGTKFVNDTVCIVYSAVRKKNLDLYNH